MKYSRKCCTVQGNLFQEGNIGLRRKVCLRMHNYEWTKAQIINNADFIICMIHQAYKARIIPPHVHTHPEREREREREGGGEGKREGERVRERHPHVTPPYIYIYIYIERERERETDWFACRTTRNICNLISQLISVWLSNKYNTWTAKHYLPVHVLLTSTYPGSQVTQVMSSRQKEQLPGQATKITKTTILILHPVNG